MQKDQLICVSKLWLNLAILLIQTPVSFNDKIFRSKICNFRDTRMGSSHQNGADDGFACDIFNYYFLVKLFFSESYVLWCTKLQDKKQTQHRSHFLEK